MQRRDPDVRDQQTLARGPVAAWWRRECADQAWSGAGLTARDETVSF